jgi:hypothetical protein
VTWAVQRLSAAASTTAESCASGFGHITLVRRQQESGVREIRTLRSMRRGLETNLRSG